MCGHCGCHGVPAIREPKSEHDAPVDEAADVRRALAAGDRPRAVEQMLGLVDHLGRHVHREDLGIFPAAVVTLGAAGWETVARAHAESPTFLPERSPA